MPVSLDFRRAGGGVGWGGGGGSTGGSGLVFVVGFCDKYRNNIVPY